MPRMDRRTWIAFVIAALAGSGLHFLHTLLPCPVTALIAPVSESLWEHLKILFWPGLIASLVLARLEGRVLLPTRLLALLLGAATVVFTFLPPSGPLFADPLAAVPGGAENFSLQAAQTLL